MSQTLIPTASERIVRRFTYYNSAANSDKFWQIDYGMFDYVVKYGRNGTNGTEQKKIFYNERACMTAVAEKISEKLTKGYKEEGSAQHYNLTPVNTDDLINDLYIDLAELEHCEL